MVYETTKSEASDSVKGEETPKVKKDEVPLIQQMKDKRYKLQSEINEAKRL